ncbi:hypothetical protein SAMN05192558_11847 [Actinokineospora alba]|uniref:Uncharacterized protein n=1 Tax=Actinokineospora alba TaxID=504798 RepID=A0A1H0W716_9PSEU|nr:DUF6239 family natural product biosynthesis protein [Actinokineospora alba]TDP70007.1 hypothetical protein C8E96_5607 [Actinokineospora alba]SDJ50036.1 hypothetical protein SAMN05421871_11747 [Actinokineospora alba]SDP86524.1 hypothetical protein SAMN05192558_11847 [Actinokineospora alba]
MTRGVGRPGGWSTPGSRPHRTTGRARTTAHPVLRRVARPFAVLPLVALLLVAGAVPAVAQQHGHTLSVPVAFGPLALKVALFYAVPAVAGFALLRGFLERPSKYTAAFVCGSAALGVVLELMLAGRLEVTNRIVFVAFVAGCLPVLLTLAPVSGNLAAAARRTAPYVLAVASVAAVLHFAKAWLGAGLPATLHSGVILALAGLAWLPLVGCRRRAARFTVHAGSALVATALLAATAQATVAVGF